MIYSNETRPVTIYYHMSTTNKSFLEMSQYLADCGVEHNKFMLVLLDPDLTRIDPYDPMLPPAMKAKILREIMYNPWYFFREVIRIPDTGVATGVKFQLHRGNLAELFCLMMNMNIFIELPRQCGKTISTLAWYLYLFNFGTANAEINLLNKRLDDSKLNLQRLRDIRDLLPSWLRMSEAFAPDGSRIRGKNNVETLQHPVNNNRIRTVASARNKVAAASLMRGRTTALIYLDEFAWMQYNDIIYSNMVPAFSTAANNAKRNGAPYGMIITTTPGMLTTDEGIEAFKMKENASPFSERWYDLSREQIDDIISSNYKSNFVYIKYNYQQLGKSEQWFKELCIQMQNKWEDIRREVLLEWANSSDNSPFNPDDLDIIRGLLRQPINTVLLRNKYELRIYERINLKYPPLMGVDVSGGYQRDSSAITIVDSYSTKVCAELNCNYISTRELAAVIYDIVSNWMPNAVINIERNGGFGASVLASLLQTSIRRNLFYTIKDKIIEERIIGSAIHKRTQKTKVYGSDSTKAEREQLMEILRDRVEYHKDKIISPIIYEELCGLEVKKNGKIEHSSNTHDDQIFSWLWALYIYYCGGDLMANWGITKRVLKTDADLEEAVVDIKEDTANIIGNIVEEEYEEVPEQLQALTAAPGKLSYDEWVHNETMKDQECMDRLMQNKDIRKAYEDRYHISMANQSSDIVTLPNSVFNNFYLEDEEVARQEDIIRSGNMGMIWTSVGVD